MSGDIFRRSSYSDPTLNVGPSAAFSSWSLIFPSLTEKPTVTEANAQGIPAFGRAVDIISTQIASLPFSVYRSTDDGGVEEAATHPLYRLLKFRPHPLYNTFDFRAALIRQLMLRGQAYVLPEVAGGNRVTRLTLLDPPADIFETDGIYFYKFAKYERPLRSEEILHFKLNSLDGINGQNPLKIYAETFARAIAEIEMGTAYYSNGGHASSLLTPKTPMNPKQAEQAMEYFNKMSTGRDKIGKVGFMPFGMDLQKLSDSMNDSKFNESRRQTVSDMSNITGVNPIMLGDLERATFTNVEELNRILVQFTLRTYCKVIETEMNSKLFSERDMGRVYVRFNMDGLLRGNTKDRAELYSTLYNIRAINPNEIRRLENMNPYEGGDQYGLPLASNVKEPADAEAETE